MAGAIAQGVIAKVTEMIVHQEAEEAALLLNFARDFDWLNKRLTTIRVGLKYVDSLSTQDGDIKEWLNNVRDIAWDAEDIVEEFAVRPLYTINVTQSCLCNPDELLFRYRMGKRIEEVKERIKSITNDGEQLRLFRELVLPIPQQPSSSAAEREVWKGNNLLPTDSHPVDIEPKIQHLISLIDESTTPVIALVGLGGAGKTYLLHHVFDRINQRYDYSIWLSISQSYSVHKLQCDLASHLGDIKDAVKDVSEERAAELIHAGLRDTESLIVLDNVWGATSEDNIIRSLGLPIGSESQCKVVVTSRNRGVEQNLHALIYEMELFSEQESWQLFCAYAFPDCHQNLPPHQLEEVASQVEKQCGRLPLALKTIGASLSSCREISQWNSKLLQLSELVNVNKDSVIQILRLSYNSLPRALKPCFAYLSFFPEDEEIDCEYLMYLWIAEGFIPQREDQWDIACSYLYQLANLCLLEVWEDSGLVKYCKIHDLLFDLAIDLSKENRNAFAIEDAFTSDVERRRSWCRISLAKKQIDDEAITQSRASCPRSLRTLSLHNNPIGKIEASFFSRMRLLRVLDLGKTMISTLPKCVAKLKFLKLLNLSCTIIEEVPMCVRSLKNLVFLDLSMCYKLRRLPVWISDLKCLQHLDIRNCHYELCSHMPKGISELVSLRVLRSYWLDLSVQEDGLLKLEDVAKLTLLQELRLNVKHEKELKSLADGLLAQLLKMRHLSLGNQIPERQGNRESHLSYLPENINALLDLQTLELSNFPVPSCVCMLANLRQLMLCGCHCSDYPALETMPNLMQLRLVGNESCRKVPKTFGKSSGFPKLRFLHIENFPLLEELPDLEDGAMAGLKQFWLKRCRRVKKVPEGLEGLKRLEEVEYGGTGTDEFRERLKEGGEDWYKIKSNNPRVRIRSTQNFN